jgi:Sel1 repeat
MGQDEIGRILAERLGQQRGYADFFDWPDKSVKEGGIAHSFFEELERDNGPKIVSAKLHPGGLAYCYAEGKGVPQNYIEAYIWFNLAAAVGLRSAANDRDRFAEKMSPHQLIDAQRKAADTFQSLFEPEPS